MLLSGIVIIIIDRLAPLSLPGGKHWALGNIFVFIGFMLIGAEDFFHEFLSTPLANSILVSSGALYYIAITYVTQQDYKKSIVYAVLGLTFLTEIFFTFIQPNYSIRSLVIVIALEIFAVLAVIHLLRYPGQALSGPKFIMIGLFLIVIIFYSGRIIVDLVEYDPQNTFYNTGIILDITVSSVFVLMNLLTIGFLLFSNASNFSTIQKLAFEDSLTGTYSRRAIMDKIIDQINFANRHEMLFSVLLIDFDHLKRINDDFGHLAGDEVLKKIAATIKSILREGDSIGRFGGDEFIFILKNANLEGAKVVTKRIMDSINSLEFSFNQTVYVSIGGAQFTPGDMSVDDLIAKADRNLYLVKEKGGNDYLIS